MFRFKQFQIKQDQTAMKVGTDGVLIGAWTDTPKNGKALDIGTGTGLISIMLAQRSDLDIDAIEIDESAFEQAKDNISNSPWPQKINLHNISLQDYTVEHKYKLIVSNPPFFTNSHKTPSENRNLARHNDSLSFDELLQKTSNMLHNEGHASFIIPFQEEQNFIETASKHRLYPNRITRVKGNTDSPIKRSMIEFSFNHDRVNYDELIIEISRHNYTLEYIELTKEFYLKM